MTLRVTVCGGGNTGHLSAVLFKQQPGVSVCLMTQNSQAISALEASQGWVSVEDANGKTLSAQLDGFSCHAQESIAQADVILITTPAHIRPQTLDQICSAIRPDKTVFLGAAPGQGGFDWLVEPYRKRLPKLVPWALKDVAHTAFAVRPGKSVRMGGAKNTLYFAVANGVSADDQQQLAQILNRLYTASCQALPSFLDITLTPGNAIMHTGALYGLYGPYAPYFEKSLPENIEWWRDCTALGAYMIEKMDQENRTIIRAAEKQLGISLHSIEPLKNEILDAYPTQITDKRHLHGLLTSNQAYRDIPIPTVLEEKTGWRLADRTARCFCEDVNFGLALLVQMAHRLGVQTPFMNEVLHWIQPQVLALHSPEFNYLPADWPAQAEVA